MPWLLPLQQEFYVNEFENIDEMGKFLESYNSGKLTQKKWKLNRLVSIKETELFIKIALQREFQAQVF